MKTLIESRQRKQNKIGFGCATCLICNKRFMKNSATQRYCGRIGKESCAYKADQIRWRNNAKLAYSTGKCRESRYKRTKEWNLAHPEYHKKWREEHKEYLRQKAKEFRARNPDYHKKYKKNTTL